MNDELTTIINSAEVCGHVLRVGRVRDGYLVSCDGSDPVPVPKFVEHLVRQARMGDRDSIILLGALSEFGMEQSI